MIKENLNKKTDLIKNLSSENRQRIEDFLLGAVYSWNMCKHDTPFSLRALMGGKNFDWEGTPLYILYKIYANRKDLDKQPEELKEEINRKCISAAGRFAGRILSKVVEKSCRNFVVQYEYRQKCYIWKSSLNK